MGLLIQVVSKFLSGPAIQRLDQIDMKIDYKDGAVLLPIVVIKHLENTDEIRHLISEKLETYLGYLNSDQHDKNAKSIVEFKCIKKPDPEICEFIESFSANFSALNSELRWKS